MTWTLRCPSGLVQGHSWLSVCITAPSLRLPRMSSPREDAEGQQGERRGGDVLAPLGDPDPPPSSPGGTGRALPFPSPQGKEQEEEAGTAGQEEESKGGKAEKGGGKAHRSAQDFIS